MTHELVPAWQAAHTATLRFLAAVPDWRRRAPATILSVANN